MKDVSEVKYIHFEVCVTTELSSSSKDRKQGSLGILKVISASINKDIESSNNLDNMSVNKISFDVPYIPAAIK